MTLSSLFSTFVSMKVLGMSTVATALTSCASIADVINNCSNLSVRLDASYLVASSLCLRPSAQVLNLIVPSHFFNNMIDSKKFLLFCGYKSLGKNNLTVSHMFICSISDSATFFPATKKFQRPSIKLISFIQTSDSCKQLYFLYLLSSVNNF